MIHATRTRKRKITLVNPQRKKQKTRARPKASHRQRRTLARKKARRANPGPAETLVLGYLNPRRTMKAKTRQKKIRNIANPRRHRRRGVRRNPDGAVRQLVLKPVQILYMGMMAALGFLLTRQLPQLVLKDKNRGLLGYGANLLTAALASGAAYRALGPTEGSATMIGGGLYVFNRLVSEQTPLGKQLALSGIGDVQASGSLGALVSAYFPYPVVYDGQGRPVIPRAIQDAIRAAIPPAPAPAPTAAPAAASAGAGLSAVPLADRFAARF